MGKSEKRISNKFEFWSVTDCACKYCKHYAGKNRLCPLEVCCCADIKEEAIKREQAANNAHTGGYFALQEGGRVLCLA